MDEAIGGSQSQADGWRRSIREHAHWMIPIAAAWVWFATVATTSQLRVIGLTNVENYGMAVYNQLFWNFSHGGQWAQTIHFGYADSWMWSGHRVGILPLVGWLYGLDPNPVWLARIQIGAVALGALPAYGLGRIAIPGRIGGLVGLVAYLGFPPLAAMALQDYQDLVIGIPLLLAACHQSRRKSMVGFLIAGLAACMAREELVAMLPLIGLAVPGPWRQRLRWLLMGTAIAAAYGGLLWYLGRNFESYDNPMMSHIGDLFTTWPPPTGRTLYEADNFYLAFLRPWHFLALLSPVTLLPALGSLFIHLTAPAHGGVDAHWRGHIHHMAPVVAFVMVATIDGCGRLVRWSKRLGRARPWALGVATVGGLTTTVVLALPWMRFLDLHPRVWVPALTEENKAPEWALAARAPPTASMATDTWASLVIASRPTAYTYDESLDDKAPGKGLHAVDYIMVRQGDTAWMRAARTHPGSALIGETEAYALFSVPD